MENIKDLFKKYGLDQNHVLGLEYKKTQFFLDELILRTEKTLIDIQEKEGLDFQDLMS